MWFYGLKKVSVRRCLVHIQSNTIEWKLVVVCHKKVVSKCRGVSIQGGVYVVNMPFCEL